MPSSRKEKMYYYTLLSRRLRYKQLREYDGQRLTRKSLPIFFSCLLVSVGLVFFYYRVTTEVQVVRSHDLVTPLEPTVSTSVKNPKESENNDTQLTVITVNNMTFILNLTQDVISLIRNISKQNLSKPVVIQNRNNTISPSPKHKTKAKKRRKSTLPLNYVNVTWPANSHRFWKMKHSKANTAPTFNTAFSGSLAKSSTKLKDFER